MNVLERIKDLKLVPVVTINNLDEVDSILSSLLKGGVPIAEICFRTDCAEVAIKKAIKDYPEMLIGAGTVIDEQQAMSAIQTGAKFIVSPGFDEGVFNVCKKHDIPYLPGAVTPTEIMNLINHDIRIIKFFPASIYGGLKAIKALSTAFPQAKFFPTGGGDNTNLKEYIECPAIFAVGGSWLLKGDIKNNCLIAKAIVKGE